MAQAVSRRTLNTEIRAGTQVSACGICVRLSDTGIGFLRVFLLSPVSGVPQFFHTDLHLNAAINRRTRQRDLATFQEETLCWKYLTFFSLCKGSVRGFPSCRQEVSEPDQHDTVLFGYLLSSSKC